jgi:glycine cleavage system H protein
MYPADRRYSKDHEWVAVEGDRARIGITDFAQQELGDIVYVELPASGREVRAGDVLGTIESVKAVSEIYAPVGGVVVERNDALGERPETVNADPHGAGWYCTLRMDDPSAAGALLDAAAYGELVGKG